MLVSSLSATDEHTAFRRTDAGCRKRHTWNGQPRNCQSLPCTNTASTRFQPFTSFSAGGSSVISYHRGSAPAPSPILRWNLTRGDFFAPAVRCASGLEYVPSSMNACVEAAPAISAYSRAHQPKVATGTAVTLVHRRIAVARCGVEDNSQQQCVVDARAESTLSNKGAHIAARLRLDVTRW